MILLQKKNNNGRLPQGTMRRILAGLRAAGIESDRDRLNYLVSRKQKLPLKNVRIDSTALVDASTLTNEHGETDALLKKRGRQFGTTIVAKYKAKEKISNCINEITKLFVKEQEDRLNDNKQCPNLFLDQLIVSKWTEYGLDPSERVASGTIRSRVQRGKYCCQHRGTPPILPHEVEKVIADTMLVMSKIRQPLSVTETIEFANSLIEKVEFTDQIKKWKSIRGLPLDSAPLGWGWWRGFSKRHKDVLVVKRGEKFGKDRADWSTESNIKQMYNEVYLNMVHAGVAKKLDNDCWMNSNGEVVQNDEEKLLADFNADADTPLGLICDTTLIHPQYVLFF
jgi:hypothetical protein